MPWTAGARTGAAVPTIVAAVLAAGCSPTPSGSGATPAPGQPGGQPAEPTRSPLSVNVAKALETSEREFAALTKGDWAGAWQLWTDSAKQQVPQDVFVAANRTCPAALRRTYALQEVKPVNDGLIELTFRRGDAVEHGALRAARPDVWAFEPSGTMLVEYANGVRGAVDQRRADGRCT